jgi:ABC-type multidrug transport system ATPase subunit
VILEIDNVSRRFGASRVLDRVSLAVAPGEFFGLLGPNGAGKSTLIAMMLGLLKPEPADGIRLFGETVTPASAKRLRLRIGVIGEGAQLGDERGAAEYLLFFARLYGLDTPVARVFERLGDVGLDGAAYKPIRTFSRGMKQRLALARALLHDPELLVLDEPTSGLDPSGVHQVRELLQRRHRAGTAVFLCSHLLSEVEKSCSRIAVIHKGRIQALGRTEEVAQGDLERAFLRLTAEDGVEPESAKERAE